MTASLALSPPLAALKLRATALTARAAGLWRAYPRETLGFGVLGLVGAGWVGYWTRRVDLARAAALNRR